jgi:hypothetical protein
MIGFWYTQKKLDLNSVNLFWGPGGGGGGGGGGGVLILN